MVPTGEENTTGELVEEIPPHHETTEVQVPRLVPDSKTFVIINLLHTFQVIISFRYGLITGGHSFLFKNLKYLTGWVQNY